MNAETPSIFDIGDTDGNNELREKIGSIKIDIKAHYQKYKKEVSKNALLFSQLETLKTKIEVENECQKKLKELIKAEEFKLRSLEKSNSELERKLISISIDNEVLSNKKTRLEDVIEKCLQVVATKEKKRSKDIYFHENVAPKSFKNKNNIILEKVLSPISRKIATPISKKNINAPDSKSQVENMRNYHVRSYNYLNTNERTKEIDSELKEEITKKSEPDLVLENRAEDRFHKKLFVSQNNRKILDRREKLFEFFAVIGGDQNTVVEKGSEKLQYFGKPKILFKFPENKRSERYVTSDILPFVFPKQYQVEAIDRSDPSSTDVNFVFFGSHQFQRGSNCHMFLLNSSNSPSSIGEQLYVLCVTSIEISFVKNKKGAPFLAFVPICYCLGTKYPFFPLHEEIMFSALSLLRFLRLQKIGALAEDYSDVVAFHTPERFDFYKECIYVISQYYNKEIPLPGEVINVEIPMGLPTISWRRPSSISQLPCNKLNLNLNDRALLWDSDEERIFMLAWWSGPIGWSLIESANQLMFIFNSLLLEYTVIIVEPNISKLSSIVISLIPLIYPLKWQGIIFPVLGEELLSFVEAPVPIIVGLPDLPLDLYTKYVEKGQVPINTIVWFPGENKCLGSLDNNDIASMPELKELKNGLSEQLFYLRKTTQESNPRIKKKVLFKSTKKHEESKSNQSILSLLKSNEKTYPQECLPHVWNILFIFQNFIQNLLSMVKRGNNNDNVQFKNSQFFKLFLKSQMLEQYLEEL